MKLRFCIIAAAALLATAASASTFVAMDSLELIENSDRVVQGEVISITSFWDDSGRLIVTEATVAVTENIAGTGNSSVIRVRTPGGRVGPLRVEAAGFPQFRRGQTVVLFLESEEGRDFERVVGFQQGHFEVVNRDDGVTLAVPQIDSNARYFYRNGTRMANPRSMELGAFKSLVRNTDRAIGPRAR